jgi:hypothetical protein
MEYLQEPQNWFFGASPSVSIKSVTDHVLLSSSLDKVISSIRTKNTIKYHYVYPTS